MLGSSPMYLNIKLLALFLFGFGHSHASPYPYPLEALEVSGVIRCVPAVNSEYYFYDMYGCNSPGGVLTIKQFFEKYRRDKNDRIIRVNYDSNQNLFHIYYGGLSGNPFPIKDNQ